MEQKQINNRLGYFTSSEIGKLLKSGRTKDKIFGDGAMTYVYEKCAEILTGERKQQVSAFATEWGNNQEKLAFDTWRKTYNGEAIYYGGGNFKYFQHPEIEVSGGSPDGLTDVEVLEFKAPWVSSNHIEALLGVKSDNHNEWLKQYNDLYYAQVQWNMECCGKDKALFISFDPRMNMDKCLAIFNIEKDIELISELKKRVYLAIDIVNSIVNS